MVVKCLGVDSKGYTGFKISFDEKETELGRFWAYVLGESFAYSFTKYLKCYTSAIKYALDVESSSRLFSSLVDEWNSSKAGVERPFSRLADDFLISDVSFEDI